MDLYLQDVSPRSSTIGSYIDIYDLVRSRRSVGDGKTGVVKAFVTILIMLSTALKIYSLIVFFSRVEVQVFLVHPDRKEADGERKQRLFATFITDFSFPEMVRDFWHARAYMVSSVIVIGSAVIPLAKHSYMFLAWLVPLSQEWMAWRRRLLVFFDQTGRTALVDLFLMGYVACIFYTKVVQGLGGYGLDIELTGEPVRGIFCGIASTFTGSILSHYMLLTHDEQNLGDFDSQVTVASGPATASLMQRLGASSMSSRYKALINLTVICLIIFSATCLTLMAVEGFEIVSFRMEGLAGSVSNAEWRPFNLFTAPLKLTHETNNYYGSLFLAVLHVALVVAVPACLLISAIILWFMPIHLKSQRRFLSLFPFWHSWCCLDVLFITSLASYLEMHLIAEFIFDKRFRVLCDGLGAFNVACVELGHEQGPGLYLLMACALLFFNLSFLLGKVGNELLETSSGPLDVGVNWGLNPQWDNVVNLSPLLSRMGSNDFVILRGGNGNSASSPAGASVNDGSMETGTTPKKATSKSMFWL